ncbi:MAG TPA: ion transporter [Tepidisphaeraceae bacterium]|jgi:voltage-gated potassium channel
MPLSKYRRALYVVVFRNDTRAGKTFDVILLALIVLSVTAVMLESVESIRIRYGRLLYAAEWAFTILFTLEYAARLASLNRPLNYARSFYGVVDLLAILPTYVGLFVPNAQALSAVRALRLLRVFRVLKLLQYSGEANHLFRALHASRRRIAVFVFSATLIVLVVGATMYVIEGPQHGFTSIPLSCYWAIVTLTTVGFGDVTPKTPPGQFLASALMLLGYGVIAVPTGIVTSELIAAERDRAGSTGNARFCPGCGERGHDPAAKFCKGCGVALPPAAKRQESMNA